MIDAEERYAAALARLEAARQTYASAETELISAEREVRAAEVGTKYYKMLRSPQVSERF